MSGVCETINDKYQQQKRQNTNIKHYFKQYKKECHEKGCYFHNSTAKCIEMLDKSRDLDFARTFATEENLKSLKYRLDLRNQIINKKIPISKIKAPNTYQIINHFISNNPPCDFMEVIKNPRYLGSGSYGHAFQLCPQESCSPEFVMKLIPYCTPDVYDNSINYCYLNIKNPLRGENVEVLQPAYLESILIKNQDTIVSPHISLPIMAFRCNYDNPSIKTLMDQVKDNKLKAFQDTEMIYNPSQKQVSRLLPGQTIYIQKNKDQGDMSYYEAEIKSYSKSNRLHKIKYSTGEVETLKKEIPWKIEANRYNPDKEILVYISEYAKGGDLYHWLNKSELSVDKFKIILFQLFYTYACIQTKDPSFRHNDLSLTNVLVQEIEIPDGYEGHYYHYQFKDLHYLIPVTTFSLRLWDMDFSNSNTVSNRKVCCDLSQNLPKYHLTDDEECYDDINFYKTNGIIKEANLQYDLFYLFYWLKTYTRYYSHIKDPELINFINSWTNPTCLHNLLPEYDISTKGRLSNNIQNKLSHDIRFANKNNKEMAEQETINLSKSDIDNNNYTHPLLWTTCTKNQIDHDIAFCDFTAGYCLEHCDVFTEFKVTEEEVIGISRKNLILANYGLVDW